MGFKGATLPLAQSKCTAVSFSLCDQMYAQAPYALSDASVKMCN